MVLLTLVIAAGLLLVVAIVALLLLNRSWGNLPTMPPVPPPLAPDIGADLETEAQHFLQRGQKIQAIKLVRERTGMGLKEAKDWVESLERGASPPTFPQSAPAQTDPAPDLEAAVQQLLQRGQKIQAIKLVRDRTGMGLKEAKDWVESLERGASPSAFPQSAPAQTDPAPDLETAVQQLLQRGQKIQAIKLVRERTGMGLKEAKDWVESLEKR